MADKIIFSDEQIEKIIELHWQGLYNWQIAEMFGTSKTKITNILHENNVPERHPWLDEEREKQIIDCYILYKNKSIVKKMMHTSDQTIDNLLDKYGIQKIDMSHVRQKYTINENYFDVLDTAEKCYYFGLLMADGYLNEKNNTLTLSLQERDRHIIESFNEAIGSNRPIDIMKFSEKNPNWSDQAVLRITNKHLKESLVKNGLRSNKSLTLEFPVDVVPEEYYPAFLLGYSDGDGHYSSNSKDKRINFIANVWFCEFVKKYIKDKLDINSSIMYCHGETDKPTRTFQIAGNNQIKKYLDWLYDNCDVHLNRKYDIYLKLYCNNTDNSLSK